MPERDFKKIIDSATEFAIITMNRNRIITSWNPGAELMLGWSREEVLDKESADIIFTLSDIPEAPEYEVREARLRGSVTDERWHRRKDGSQFWALGRMMSMRDSDGEIAGYVKILLDQTRRKMQQEELEKINEELEDRVEQRTRDLIENRDRLRSLANRLNRTEEIHREELAADLHDNLGQILAVSLMELELLQRRLSDPDATNIATIKGLINDAIRYTRDLMSDLKPPVELKGEDLRTLMNWIARRMEKHDLKVEIEDDGTPKPLDEPIKRALFQAVRELLFNVVKHSGVTSASIGLSTRDDLVTVVVKDRGSGFNPVAAEVRSSEDGGFGLFNIKERMELFGGKVNIDSSPGKGTAVTITVPLETQAHERQMKG